MTWLEVVSHGGRGAWDLPPEDARWSWGGGYDRALTQRRARFPAEERLRRTRSRDRDRGRGRDRGPRDLGLTTEAFRLGDPEGDAIIYVPSNTGEGRATRMRRAEYDEEVEKHFRSLEDVNTLFNAYITTLEGLKVGKNDAVLAQLQGALQDLILCITLKVSAWAATSQHPLQELHHLRSFVAITMQRFAEMRPQVQGLIGDITNKNLKKRPLPAM